MEFVIKDRDGRGVFKTKYPQCVPLHHIDSMNTYNYQFYIDGKKVSASTVKSTFSDVEPVAKEEFESVKSESKTNSEPATKSDKIDLSSVDFSITSRTIVCMNNKKVYRNQKEAGDDLNLDPSSISYSMSQNKPYKGYTFVKAVDLK